MANQRFDTDRAGRLKIDLKSNQQNVERELNNMLNKVKSVREWWSGGSEEAFIEKFDTTSIKIKKSLNECIQGYCDLVDQITEAKIKADQDIAAQLKK